VGVGVGVAEGVGVPDGVGAGTGVSVGAVASPPPPLQAARRAIEKLRTEIEVIFLLSIVFGLLKLLKL